jgi:hypothetical protein
VAAEYSWTITNPSTGIIPGPKIYAAQTAVKISSYVTAATNATFNIQDRTTAPNTTGTNLLSSDQTAVATGTDATVFASAIIAQNSWLAVNISSVSGTPGTLSVTLATTTP